MFALFGDYCGGGIMKQTTKEKFKKLLRNLFEDISYSNGGWLFFISRMFINCVILWIVMKFLVSWFTFIFFDIGITGVMVDSFNNILWCIGVLFIVLRGFRISEVKP